MMNHPSPLAWSYLVLFSGIAIILIAFGMALRNKREMRHQNPKIDALDSRLQRGEITQDEYNRRRAEILIEQSKKHRAA